jgi:uncharacterized protein (DUF736 family)
MNNFEHKECKGSLFKNERKTKDTQPDYYGECKIHGIDFEIGAWIKSSKNGKKFLSLSFSNMNNPEAKKIENQESKIDF